MLLARRQCGPAHGRRQRDDPRRRRAEPPLDPDAPVESRRVRRARWDGFTGPKQAIFLEQIGEGATVEQAAKAAGISPQAAYNLRNRRAGRAFNIAWEAANRRQRRPLADSCTTARSRADPDLPRQGRSRRRHPPLSRQPARHMLTRLDRKAEAYKRRAAGHRRRRGVRGAARLHRGGRRRRGFHPVAHAPPRLSPADRRRSADEDRRQIAPLRSATRPDIDRAGIAWSTNGPAPSARPLDRERQERAEMAARIAGAKRRRR